MLLSGPSSTERLRYFLTKRRARAVTRINLFTEEYVLGSIQSGVLFGVMLTQNISEWLGFPLPLIPDSNSDSITLRVDWVGHSS